MITKYQVKRGLKATMPILDEGELGLARDTGELFIGTSTGNISVSNSVLVQNKIFYATEGQTVFDISNIGSYEPGKNLLFYVAVGSVPQDIDNYTESSSTTFTLSEGVPAGTKVTAKWFKRGVTLINAHSNTHKLGGGDEIHIKDLAGYNAVPKFPILPSIEGNNVVREDLPYGHVDRYGAQASDSSSSSIFDSTTAIQTAADVVHALSKGVGVWTAGAFTLLFGSGNYKITKTIRLFYDKVTFSKDAAFNIKGQYRKRVADKLGIGTVIRPLIPNHNGKTYANAFSINIKYSNDISESDTIAFDTLPLQTINSFTMEDISFTLTDEEALTYNICALKGYRFRMDAKNLSFTNVWRGIWQPEKDVNNLYNYCDFSTFENLTFTYLKHIGVELYTADCSSIKSVYNHRPKSTFDALIKITRGSVTINDVTHSLHGDYNESGTFVPRNDGTGQTGTKAIFKLFECSAAIKNVYTERPLTDYVFYLKDVHNFSLDTYHGKFVGNGFISINGTCGNIEYKNILRNENIVSEYLDIYIAPSATFVKFTPKSFLPRNYYTESLNLASTLTGLTAISEGTIVTRDIKHNVPLSLFKNVDGEEIRFRLRYDGTNWVTHDIFGNSMTNALGTFNWNTDGVSFIGTKLSPCFIVSVEAGHVDDTTLPHVPIMRGNIERLRFWNRSTGALVTTQDTKMCALITIKAIFNMSKLP